MLRCSMHWYSKGFPTCILNCSPPSPTSLPSCTHMQVGQMGGGETRRVVYKFRNSRPEVLCKNSCSKIVEVFARIFTCSSNPFPFKTQYISRLLSSLCHKLSYEFLWESGMYCITLILLYFVLGADLK